MQTCEFMIGLFCFEYERLTLKGTSIKCVHDGHVGGPKQYNDFPLGNIFYFYANNFYCFSPPTWLPCTHSIDVLFVAHKENL